MKKEEKLQSKMVIDFDNKLPEKKRQLWHTRNISLSKIDGSQMKALGMVSGVADLIYFNNSIFTGIEVKFPDEPHELTHVINQYKWGEVITREGGQWFLVTSVVAFWSVINGKYSGAGLYSLDQVGEIIKKCKTKTIKFA